MLTLSDKKTLLEFKPKKYNSPVYAIHALYNLDYFEFIIYRNKIIMRLPEFGFKIELPNGKWKRYRQGLEALDAVEFSGRRQVCSLKSRPATREPQKCTLKHA